MIFDLSQIPKQNQMMFIKRIKDLVMLKILLP